MMRIGEIKSEMDEDRTVDAPRELVWVARP
jgi:hypothetical protein